MAKKFIVKFKDGNYFKKVRKAVEPRCGKGKSFPTTRFNQEAKTVTVTNGILVDPTSISEVGFVLSEPKSINSDHIILDPSLITVNRTSPYAFLQNF